MTDATNFYRTLISNVTQLISALESCKLMADRITADSAMSTKAAAAAQTGGRSDLAAADFDNFNAAIQVLETLLNNANASVNTGGSVRLAFYKLM